MCEKLRPIEYDRYLTAFDLSQTSPCEDRLMTVLTLSDGAGVFYHLRTILPTREQGYLEVTVEYWGAGTSIMTVMQNVGKETYEHNVTFPSWVFRDFVKEFMKKHTASWDTAYAFDGGQEAVMFYNRILETAVFYEVSKVEKQP